MTGELLAATQNTHHKRDALLAAVVAERAADAELFVTGVGFHTRYVAWRLSQRAVEKASQAYVDALHAEPVPYVPQHPAGTFHGCVLNGHYWVIRSGHEQCKVCGCTKADLDGFGIGETLFDEDAIAEAGEYR